MLNYHPHGLKREVLCFVRMLGNAGSDTSVAVNKRTPCS